MCEEEVPYSDIAKGYEYEEDRYVILEKEELEQIKLKSNKAIDIEAFVDLAEVSPSRFEAVYYLGPNGDVAKVPYALFVKTLQQSGKAGVGRIVLREKEDVCLISAHEDGLIMYKLRYPEELRSIKNVPNIEVNEVDKAQLALAQTLVSSLTKPFEEISFEDHYADAIKSLVDEKIKGNKVVTIDEAVEEAPVVDIMEALKRSIEEAKKAGS